MLGQVQILLNQFGQQKLQGIDVSCFELSSRPTDLYSHSHEQHREDLKAVGPLRLRVQLQVHYQRRLQETEWQDHSEHRGRIKCLRQHVPAAKLLQPSQVQDPRHPREQQGNGPGLTGSLLGAFRLECLDCV